MKKYTFEELSKLESGTILEDYFDEGIRILIMRGPGSLCCYLGVPKNHPLAGFGCDDISLNCHGGLTFAGGGENWPKDFYWYGWDYSHCGDKNFYNLKYPRSSDESIDQPEIGWTVELVKKDIWEAVDEFKRLIKLSEKIKNKN